MNAPDNHICANCGREIEVHNCLALPPLRRPNLPDIAPGEPNVFGLTDAAAAAHWKTLAMQAMRFLTAAQIAEATRAAGAQAFICGDNSALGQQHERP